MNRRLTMSLVLSGMLAVSAGFARAQEAPALPPRGEMLRGDGPGRDSMPPPMGDRVELMGFEGMRGGKLVTGAPFSGVAVTESTQTLADGNHITHKTQSNVFRDSQGRVRKEIAFSGFGPMAASAEQKGHAGHEMKGLARGSAFEEKMQARQEAEIAAGTLKKEDLGTQVIGGVSTQGTRLTHTIPAGQIGNEKPILVVHETWFSNDLQIVVMSKRSNPMGGTTTYTLTNIQRTEPAASLFAVPSDYTVKQGGPGKRGMGEFKQGAPMPPPSEN